MEILPQLTRVEPSVSAIPLVNELPTERSFAQFMAESEASAQKTREGTAAQEDWQADRASERTSAARAKKVNEHRSSSASEESLNDENSSDRTTVDHDTKEVVKTAEEDSSTVKTDGRKSASASVQDSRSAREREVDTEALAALAAELKDLQPEALQDRTVQSPAEKMGPIRTELKGLDSEIHGAASEQSQETVVHRESGIREEKSSNKLARHGERITKDQVNDSDKNNGQKAAVNYESKTNKNEEAGTVASDKLKAGDASSFGRASEESVNVAAVAALSSEMAVSDEATQEDGEQVSKAGGLRIPGTDDIGNTRETAQALSSIREAGESGRRSGEAKSPQVGVREISVELTQEPAANEITPANDGVSSPVSFREVAQPVSSVPLEHLARRLNGDLGESVVRQAQILMSEGDKAEIRLIIRPPELGRVRIQLQMEQGHIAGRILVDNANVRQVVEQNLAALQRAFAEAGLEMGQLDVRSGDSQEHAGQQPTNDDSRTNGRKVAQLEQSVRTVAELDYGQRHINLVA